MTPWDTKLILLSLEMNGLTADDIAYVISTHGHSDHTGNNNLFLKAKHIVGYCVSFKDKYYLHPFDKGKSMILHMNLCTVIIKQI
jgi:glyoxylase-like metal-dependent hydrolase (beta-lactamase superfamily II)